MRIAIFGTGGAGGYFRAHLARSGEEVIFIARGAHLNAIRSQGLRVETAKGELLIHPATATDNPKEIGPVDVVILGTKAWQVQESAKEMQPLMGSETFVVPLQNGVEAAAQLASELNPDHVVGGLCATISMIAGPGHIRSLGEAHYIKFAELNGKPSKRTEQLRMAFEKAGVKAEIPANIDVALWEKFLFVVSFGGVGSVARAPIGVLRSLPETRAMLEICMNEIFNVAKTRKIAFPEGIVVKTMKFLDTLPATGTTSLQRDLIAGKPSELEAWNGAVVRLGKESGVATPVHQFIYQSQLPSEMRARGKVQFPT
ncbi:2-dehydropantoate 2-reductase [Candidatus Acetothermia bacterium]|nr:2-dehydropantoate 2-reductase [Candidatus Acetothermia bacterium]MBI3642670.1 2-dehydropantoate 2-reductase [Candidatus Acetothermia bacterium]